MGPWPHSATLLCSAAVLPRAELYLPADLCLMDFRGQKLAEQRWSGGSPGGDSSRLALVQPQRAQLANACVSDRGRSPTSSSSPSPF
ncbi:hypothetical protein WJX74_010292 [Apatococcus lobatus]